MNTARITLLFAIVLLALSTASAQATESPPGPLPCGDRSPVSDGGEPLYALPRDGSWGFVDRSGTWIIEPQWDRVQQFSEGRAVVHEAGLWGIIDRQGEYVLEPSLRSQQFSRVDGERVGAAPIKPFSEGCAAAVGPVASDNPFFIGHDGTVYWQEALPEELAQYDVREFGPFSEGKAWFRSFSMEESTHGWIDAQGNVAIEPDFVGAGNYAGGLAPAAAAREQWGFIDPSGELVLPGKWTLAWAGSFSEGLAIVDIGTYEYAYLGRSDFAFTSVDFTGSSREELGQEVPIAAGGDFHDGLAPVRTDIWHDRVLAYVRPNGTVSFVPADIDGVAACDTGRLPEFREGLLRLLVADDGEECGEGAFSLEFASYDDAHYIYLDERGEIVLRQSKAAE